MPGRRHYRHRRHREPGYALRGRRPGRLPLHRTITVSGITAVDAKGNTYTITGASWFGGEALSETQNLVATDTGHFVIHSASGGVYAKVQVVDHFTLNGKRFTFDIGGCEAPQG